MLADLIRPKIDYKLQQFLLDELKRMRFLVNTRNKIINAFGENPWKAGLYTFKLVRSKKLRLLYDFLILNVPGIFKSLDDEEEKVVYI